MSAVRVAPMKIPSSWKLHTATKGARTAQGSSARAAPRTSGTVVRTSISRVPSAA
jgi:hypothetical protein